MVSTFYARKRTRQLSPMSPPIVASNPQTIKSSLIPPLPMTPPDPDVDSASSSSPHPSSVDTAIHVIATERAALENLERVYSTNELARNNMERAVEQIANTINAGSKLIVCGVGKSGKIGEKVVATMNSLGIYCSFLHPTEALHGDLGMVRPTDTVLFITYSGKTSELLLVLPHLPPTTSVIVITTYKQPSSCPLLAGSSNANTILLPSPIHEPEEVSFGVCAPTSSTTVALAVGDALALAVARRLHTTPGRGPAEVFKGYHPGGAIGAAAAAAASTSISGSSTPLTSTSTTPSQSMSVNGIQDESEPSLPPAETTLCRSITDIMIPAELIPTASPRNGYPLRVVDVMRASLQGSTSKPWAFIRPGYIVSPRRLRSMVACNDPEDSIENVDLDMSIGQQIEEWIRVPSTSTVDNVRQTLGRPKQNNIASPLNAAMKRDSEGNTVHRKRRVISVINEMTNTVVGFAEEEDLEHSEDMFK
ncbi:SIS domain-containing protein [Trichophyton interdigitale]|uniref:SIS domain-containing protein n=1 Tax=Trichophyton interdigitale TaxID=101480 RepID=A0A9P4YK44_9EURO|nr:SIS domain-containing protein [Trichophyton interdigitale]KAF3899448.1 SIS domain-containing protein [Trichophyton interdigitale]KAG8210887.1 SIS domain-containing protein [Trichophyton interdigitale]